MKRITKPLVFLLAGIVAATAVLPLASLAQNDPAAAPATAAGNRDVQAIITDLQATTGELQKVVTSPQELLSPKGRKEQGPKAIGPLKKMAALLGELGQADPRFAEQSERQQAQFHALLVALGDDATEKTLEAQAKGEGAKATDAKLTLALGQWWKNSEDAKAQQTILDNVKAVAKANPESEQVLGTLMMMSQMGAANKELTRAAQDVVINDLKGETAQMIAGEIKKERKIEDEFLNKPVTLTGKTINGKDFSTADWKGKVVLVDFWATWCGPCIAEMPHMKEIYKKYHDKGLEIVGISLDRTAADLKEYLKENPDVSWTQVYGEDGKPNALADKFGVEAIPTMFLIDRKGVLRTMEARGQLDELIPQLLAEKADAPADTNKDSK